MIKKFVKYGLIIWLLLTIIGAPFYWPFLRMVWVFMPRVAEAKFEPPASIAEARQQDIDYLVTLTEYDRAFSDEAKQGFSEKLARLRTDAADLNDAQFYLGVAEAIALADNGHTNVSYRPQYTEFETIGARFYAFSDGVYIVSTSPDKAHTLGAKVIAVNDTPIEDVRDGLQRYRGGNKTWRTLFSSLIIEAPALLSAAGYGTSPDAVMLTLETDADTVETIRFDALSRDADADISGRSGWQTLIPGGGAPVGDNWPHIFTEGSLEPPRYLSVQSEPLSYDLDANGLYIRALPGFVAGDQPIKSAYKAILADYEDASLDYLVVDFRLHDGGDYTKSMAFAKAAPERVKDDGEIYIITGPNTFSAAIVTTAMLKYYSGDRGIIVGEQMGDREQFWAERGTSFTLPNSGYWVNYATGYHDWEKGCKGTKYCYTMNEMYEVPAGSLAPEVVITQDFASYARGEDVVMDWIENQQ